MKTTLYEMSTRRNVVNASLQPLTQFDDGSSSGLFRPREEFSASAGEEGDDDDEFPWSPVSSSKSLPLQKTSVSTESDSPPLGDRNSAQNDAGAVALPASQANQLLLVALLEHLCGIYVADPLKSHQLFRELSGELVRQGIMSPVATRHELSPLRAQYRTAFSHLVEKGVAANSAPVVTSSPSVASFLQTAKSLQERAVSMLSLGMPSSLGLPSAGPRIPLADATGFRPSRFQEEFSNVTTIDRGAYGKVFRVCHRLDGCEYAVKRVPLCSATPTSLVHIMREVKHLAALSHANIVRYHSAWWEHESITQSSSGSEGYPTSHTGDKTPSPSCSPPRSPPRHAPPALTLVPEVEIEECSSLYSPKPDNSLSIVFDANSHSDMNGGYTVHNDSSARVEFTCESLDSTRSIDSQSTDSRSADSRPVQSMNLQSCPSVKNRSEHDDDDDDENVNGASDETDDECLSDKPDLDQLQERQRKYSGSCNDLTSLSIHVTDDDDGPPRSPSMHRQCSTPANMPSSLLGQLIPRQHTGNLVPLLPSYIPRIIPGPIPPLSGIVLYIQMELCSLTLKDWLCQRNYGPQHLGGDTYSLVCERTCGKILQQILKGLSYVHQRNIIHRDIKPKNIFLIRLQNNEVQVKLGDFGLARGVDGEPLTPSPGCSPHSSPRLDEETSDGLCYTRGVGTTNYASPEQLAGSQYNLKCDLYSVGVVMFELYQPFFTAMERAKTLLLVNKGELPVEFKQSWPQKTQYIRALLAKDPELRPTADDMLDCPLFLSKDKEISNLRSELSVKDEHISKQAGQIADLQAQLTQLQAARQHWEAAKAGMSQHHNDRTSSSGNAPCRASCRRDMNGGHASNPTSLFNTSTLASHLSNTQVQLTGSSQLFRRSHLLTQQTEVCHCQQQNNTAHAQGVDSVTETSSTLRSACNCKLNSSKSSLEDNCKLDSSKSSLEDNADCDSRYVPCDKTEYDNSKESETPNISRL